MATDPSRKNLELASSYFNQGKLDLAENLGRQVLKANPRDAEGLHLLGLISTNRGKYISAVQFFERAIGFRPKNIQYHASLGSAYRAMGKIEEAIKAFQSAIDLAPKSPSAAFLRGIIHMENAQYYLAIPELIEATKRLPGAAQAFNMLGIAYQKLNRVKPAIPAYEAAIKIAPAFAEAHFNLGTMYLKSGDFARGWQEYAWLLRTEAIINSRLHNDIPHWDGSKLNDKALLVYVEQGVGDALQCIRYLPMLKERCKRVVVECTPDLTRLFKRLPGIDQLIERNDPLPADVAFRCPFMELPGIFDTRLATIPANIPIDLNPDLIASWQQKLAPLRKQLNVGLVWSGNPIQVNNVNRSVPFEKLQVLSQFKDVQFFSLQKSPRSDDLRMNAFGQSIIELGSQLNDFADTAAVMTQLDLVISVCTSVAHLAGVMGKPVWIMLASVDADWRWLEDRDDSPWYPTARLFRRQYPEDWSAVVDRVAEALRNRSDSR